MNDIFMCGQNFSAITNSIQADLHKHWLLQLFIGTNEELLIKVDDKIINCRAIVINMNTEHAFYSGNSVHFTMLVDPTSQLGRSMRRDFLNDQPYHIICEDRAVEFQLNLLNAINDGDSQIYSVFIKNIVSHFNNSKLIEFDKRIEVLIRRIDACDCEDALHQVKYIAEEMSLSESRLSHHFKEETGIPLKSYIVLHKLQRVYQKIFDGISITDAAIASGFDSSSHFAYINKKMTGMSARDIMKNSRFVKVSL